MSRPLRIEFPGAVYHVTSRGDRREAIYRDDADRHLHLRILGQAAERFDAPVLAYCQMGNHFHVVLQTRQANLSRLMRHVNGVYTQAFNRRHGVTGHVFQGRFKAILVDRDAYLLVLCRYVERNPVAAGLVAVPEQWPWSSCRAHLGMADAPRWLDVETVHGHLLGRPAADARDRRRAIARYAALVSTAVDADTTLWQDGLRQQVFLGDAPFVARMQALAAPAQRAAPEIPRLQRGRPETLLDCLARHEDRAQALRVAHRECGLTMTAIAETLRLSVSRVSRIIAAAERAAQARGKT